MTQPDSDNLFTEDIDRLLESLEEMNPDEIGGKDDFESLFEASFSEIAGAGESSLLPFSTLPSDRELQELFGESEPWSRESPFKLPDRAPAREAKASREIDREGSPAFFASSEEELSFPEDPPESSDFSFPPVFYEAIGDLEAFLQQPSDTLPADPSIFTALEALLAEPVSIPVVPIVPAGSPTPKPVPETVEIQPEPALTVTPVEDDFQDLVALLDPHILDAPNNITGPTQRPLSRPRPNNKIIEQSMRVPIKQLDNLSNLIGELVVKRNRLEQDQERLRLFLDNLLNQVQNLSDVGGRMQDLHERTLLEGALLASRKPVFGRTTGESEAVSPEEPPGESALTDLDALEMDRFTDFHLLSQEMIELIVRVRESASDIQFVIDETDQVTRSLRQATTQLQEGMTKSRMVPFAQTADRLPRAIRDISFKLNKQAKLEVEGRDVLIDKMILEHLNSPMTHLVNNAITHGIESPRERQEKGKPPEGTISVRAFLQGNQTVITVIDDGAGIDADRVKRKAIEKGLITEEESRILTRQEVYELLFHPGFSTKDKADDFAGRGVGLDVVRTSLIDVRGTVTIDSILGKGTTFTIRLPLTLSICKALCCVSDRARIGFSMDGVEETKDFPKTDIRVDAEGRPCIPWNNSFLPFQPLSDLLSYNRQISRGTIYGGKSEEDTIPIIILRGGNNLLAVQVDQVLGEQEIVIKQIEGPIPRPSGIAGATVMGDGTILPIGDVLELIDIAAGRLRTDSAGPWRKRPPIDIEPESEAEPMVLIVDDSITVRELLSLSFNKAGYRVEQARDGQEAWEKLRGGLPCDIVFCDIEMPRMNGLELLSNIQKDPRLSRIPIALLTSRGAERHRKVAAQLGASGYFTKPYTERDLLDAAGRMIAGEVLLANSNRHYQLGSVSIDGYSDGDGDEAGDSGESPLVLIVDDSVMVREMLSLSFTKAGYRIDTARDGQEAWEKLSAGLPCQLILCDIEMPRMNGLELLSRLQEDENLNSIPVAMITSRGAQKMQAMAAEKGAKGYFVKPYIEDVLIDAARRLIAGEVLLERHSIENSPG
ncbi:hybrid sensor histidine kinase/response regulator [Pannus brasiliensis CCIBt3594]|uniref:histidine kinase n=1 Tax=Pannus brasiliensis CCIBt3594 TaxID=1427578 RepID=A0AAW9QLZ6_9CHRO